LSTFWCERALLDGPAQAEVRITQVEGTITAVEAGVGAATANDTVLLGVVIPGLANTHSHAFHRALRSRTQAGAGSFWTWRDQMYLAAARLNPDLYHRLARATFGEMAMAGITAVGEFNYIHHQPDGTPYSNPNAMSEALVDAAAEAGIRITLLDTAYFHGGLGAEGHKPAGNAQLRFSDGNASAWIQRMELASSAPHAKLGAAIHSVRAVAPDSIQTVAAWAASREAPLHVHVSEQPAENEQVQAAFGATPTELLERCGALGHNTTAVHATYATPSDIRRLADSGASVCFCPTTERDLADGIGPSAALAAAGVNLSLGSDSHAVIDMFEEARAVELNERLATQRRGSHSAGALTNMATIGGHRALGWPDAGQIKPGMRADLVAVSTNSVRLAGASSTTAEAIVFAASAADITDVICDGSAIVRDSEHCTLDVVAELDRAITELLD